MLTFTISAEAATIRNYQQFEAELDRYVSEAIEVFTVTLAANANYQEYAERYFNGVSNVEKWHLQGKRASVLTINFTVTYSPELLILKGRKLEYKEKLIQNAAKSTLSKIVKDDMTDYDKIKAVHDFIVLNTAYDEYTYQNGEPKRNAASPFDSYGVFMEKSAVCDGYTRAFYLLTNMLGYDSIVVNGESLLDNGAHSWNKIKLDGRWYNVDSTWDDPIPDKKGRVLHNYFLISDKKMRKDHKWVGHDYPVATQDY